MSFVQIITIPFPFSFDHTYGERYGCIQATVLVTELLTYSYLGSIALGRSLFTPLFTVAAVLELNIPMAEGF
jgi:hypothetical protein